MSYISLLYCYISVNKAVILLYIYVCNVNSFTQFNYIIFFHFFQNIETRNNFLILITQGEYLEIIKNLFLPRKV